MIGRGILASYLLSPLTKFTYPESTSQFKLVKHSNSNTVNDLLINRTIQVTLSDNMETFCYTCKIFELKKNLLKMTPNIKLNVDLASSSDKKAIYDFAKEIYFDLKAQVIKCTQNRFIYKIT